MTVHQCDMCKCSIKDQWAEGIDVHVPDHPSILLCLNCGSVIIELLKQKRLIRDKKQYA